MLKIEKTRFQSERAQKFSKTEVDTVENVGIAFGQVLLIVFNMLQLVIIISVMISWVGADPSNQIVTMIRSITEPLYKPLRPLTSKIPGPIDWAPMAWMLIIVFCTTLIRQWMK